MTTNRTVQYTGPDSDFLTVLNKKHVVYVVTAEYLDYDLPTVVITPLGGGGGIAVRADEVRDVKSHFVRPKNVKIGTRKPLNNVPYILSLIEYCKSFGLC